MTTMTTGHAAAGLRLRLSVMMFLQFFIWGAWYPLVFGYLPSLGFTEDQQFYILTTFNVAALVALFFSTQFADRNFAAEKFLAFSHLVGGLAILALFWVRKPDPETPAAFWPFFLLLLVHSLFYVPTISITNSIAFSSLKDAQKEFGQVRLWGTIGWIAAAWPFVFILVDWNAVPAFGSVPFFDWLKAVLGTPKTGDAFRQASSYIFITAGAASLVLAAFSLMLPHTPPKPAVVGSDRFAWLEAMRLLRHPFVLVLFIVTLLDAAIHQCYFYWTERYLTQPGNTGVGIASNWVMPVMSIGQVAEILTMAILGPVLALLGWRTTMIIGILGHAARFAVFAFLPFPAVAITANLLHGICYAFFFATVYIFVDEFFPKNARSSAQGLFNALILGLGPMLGNYVSGMLGARYKVAATLNPDGSVAVPAHLNFEGIFLYPMGTALVAAVLLLVFFHPPRTRKEQGVPDKETLIHA